MISSLHVLRVAPLAAPWVKALVKSWAKASKIRLTFLLPFVGVSSLLAQFSTSPGNIRSGLDPTALSGDSMPVYLTGKVTMADGSPVPGSVNIQRVCGNSLALVAYTDAGGYFSFQWRDTTAANPDFSNLLTDAEAGSTVFQTAAASTSNCELRADLPGFRSDSVELYGHLLYDNPNVGTIVVHRIANVEGLAVSATAYKAPAEAKKDNARGLQFLHKGKAADAEKNFEKAVSIYPQYANAWLDLGKARLLNKEHGNNSSDLARAAFLKALEADDKLVEAQIQMGMLAAVANQWTDAAKYFDTSLRLDPVDFPRLWFADAIANFNIKKYVEAEKSIQEALKLDPQHRNPAEEHLFGMILAARQDYKGAAEELRAYVNLAPGAPDVAAVKTELSLLENLQTPDSAGKE